MHLYQQVSDQNHYYEGVRSLEEEVCQFNIRFICSKNSYFISESFFFFFCEAVEEHCEDSESSFDRVSSDQ